jgi:hypothetical protein
MPLQSMLKWHQPDQSYFQHHAQQEKMASRRHKIILSLFLADNSRGGKRTDYHTDKIIFFIQASLIFM